MCDNKCSVLCLPSPTSGWERGYGGGVACFPEVLHFFDFRERLLSVARFLTAPWLFHWPSSVTSDTFLSRSCAFMFLFIRENWFHDTSNDWGNPDVYQNHLTMSSLWRRACDYKTFRKYKLLFITITRTPSFTPPLSKRAAPEALGLIILFLQVTWLPA